MFWTQRWKYERTPQDWVISIHGPHIKWAKPTNELATIAMPPWGKKAIDLLEDALDKLVLEKKLEKEEGENMKKMISGTEEDAYVAISIMATLKPKKFKRTVEELS